MHYAKAKDGSYPGAPKGEKVEEPKGLGDIEKDARIKMIEADKEAEMKRVEAEKKVEEIPKLKEPEVKKKKK